MLLRPGSADVAETARRLAAAHGGTLLHVYDSALEGFAVRLPSDDVARRLGADPAVAAMEQDQLGAVAAVTQSSAPWSLDRVNQSTLPLDDTYSYTNTGLGVRVYILDTGIRTSHDEFGGRAMKSFDAVAAGAVAGDCIGHGTAVASLVGGTKYGTAKKAWIRDVRVIGCNSTYTGADLIAGLNWVKKNHMKPAVANLSLGGGVSVFVDSAVKSLVGAGVTVVAAAGNSNADACTTSPARVAAAITVGATTYKDVRWSLSNWGKCLDLYAPGANVPSATADTDISSTSSSSGTSLAAPLTAGVAALFLQQSPNASPKAVRDFIVIGASSVGKIVNGGAGPENRLLWNRG